MVDSAQIVTIACALITGICGIVVAVVESRAQKDRKTMDARAACRAKESRLSMDMMYASIGLALDTARAMRDGHTNGTLEADLAKAESARSAYEGFLRDEAAANVTQV